MRKQLRAYNDERMKFTGVFERIGHKPGYKGRASSMTVLLKDVRNEKNEEMTDHIWLNYTQRFQELNLSMGDRIEFYARVGKYKKGESGKIDYKLSHPTKVNKIEMNLFEVVRRTRATNELNAIITEIIKEGSWKG